MQVARLAFDEGRHHSLDGLKARVEGATARVEKRLSPVGIRLVQGDAGQADLGGATHVFTNWLALTDETKARLVERFRTCAPGTRFITVTRPIESPDFARLSRHRLLFTWGFEFVWIHEYRPQAEPAP